MESNSYMTITLYMACNTLICTILFSLLESSKIILFKDLVEEIFEAKVSENGFFLQSSRDFEFICLHDKIFK